MDDKDKVIEKEVNEFERKNKECDKLATKLAIEDKKIEYKELLMNDKYDLIVKKLQKKAPKNKEITLLFTKNSLYLI